MRTEASRKRTRQILTEGAYLAVSLLLIVGFCFQMDCGSAPHDASSYVPLGSKLSDLDRYYPRGGGSEGEVIQWLPLAKGEKRPHDAIENEFGVFKPMELGSYDQWGASTAARDSFTGEITFYHHSLTSSDVNALYYIDGKLKKREWGFLPG